MPVALMATAMTPNLPSENLFIVLLSSCSSAAFFVLSRATKSPSAHHRGSTANGDQIPVTSILDQDGNAVSQMQHSEAECIRMQGLEVNDLSGSFGSPMELLGSIFPAGRTAAFDALAAVPPRLSRSSRAVLPQFLGTKLEHGAWECYMWITRDRRAPRIGERIGSVQGGLTALALGRCELGAWARSQSGHLQVNFESGERRWREA